MPGGVIKRSEKFDREEAPKEHQMPTNDNRSQPSADVPIQPLKKMPYTRPSITRVPLRPEEAVLGFCKSSNKKGPMKTSRCNLPACSTMGS